MRRFLIVALLGTAALSIADVDYALSVDVPAQAIKISMQFKGALGNNDISIPAWCPGFYTIKNYQSKIFDLRVRKSSGEEVSTSKLGDRTWRIPLEKPDDLIVSYRVQGDDAGLGFFGTKVDSKRAFINGPSAFLYVEGRKSERYNLTITPPQGWPVATPMPTTLAGFSSPDYDELIDHPIQLGAMSRKSFTVANIPFEVVVVSPSARYPNMDELAASLALTSAPAIQLFGSAPFKKYIFFFHTAVGDFAGGLEHRASNVIAMNLSSAADLETLASHEYFHAWNVKQIRPKVLGPFDYTKQVRTKNLWFSEGVTDYYAHMLQYKSGQMSEPDLLEAIGYQIDELQASKTRKSKTLEDTCWNTWESGGFGFGDLSYYTKGLLAELVFDAAILDATNGSKSLDDILRILFERTALPKPGFEEDAILKIINEVSEKDLTRLYNTVVRSTDELPYELLRSIGLEVVPQNAFIEEFGFDVNRESTVDVVVAPEVSAMGLQQGDLISSIDGAPFDRKSWRSLESNTYSARVVRNGLPLELNLRKIKVQSSMYRLRRIADAPERSKRLYQIWLNRLF